MQSTASALGPDSSNLCLEAWETQAIVHLQAQSTVHSGKHATSSRLQCDSKLACRRHRRLSSHRSVDSQMRQRATYLASTHHLVERHATFASRGAFASQPQYDTQAETSQMTPLLPTTTRFTWASRPHLARNWPHCSTRLRRASRSSFATHLSSS